MSGLPSGWTEATLAGLFTLVRGLTYAKADATQEQREGYLPLLRANNIQNGKVGLDDLIYLPRAIVKDEQIIRDGDILMATSSGSRTVVGKAAMAPEVDGGITFGAFCGVLRPHYEGAEGYAFQYFRSRAYREYVEAVAIGTNINNFRSSDIQSMGIPLAPLAEQERIVAKLDALSAKSVRARTDLSRIETLVSRYKQAVLTKAFRDVVPRKAVGEFVARIKAGKNLRCEERPPHSHELGVVKVSAVTWGEFRADQSKTLPPDFRPDEDTRIRPGDFLFSRANTIELVGAVVIVAETPDNLYLSDKILRLEFNEPVEAWLLWYLRSPEGREALMNISSGNQLSMRNIGQKSLLSLSVPYADSKSRNEIVRRIESAFTKIDRLAIEAKRALKLLGRLDEAILAKAFRGELVPQDEADEPASVLLERIKQARNNQPAKSKRTAPKRHGKVPDMARTIVETLVEAKDWLNAQELFARCGVRDGSSTEDVEKLYRQLLELERQEKVEIEEVLDPLTGDKQGNRVRLRK